MQNQYSNMFVICLMLVLLCANNVMQSSAFQLCTSPTAYLASTAASTSTKCIRHTSLVMKGGRGGKVPPHLRGEYVKRQRMMEQQQQTKRQRPTDVPVFEIFARSKRGGIWVPTGELAGDNRAASLVNAWMSGFLTDFYRGQLDRGVARSIYAQEDVFTEGLIKNYRPFNKFTKDDLEFGYKVSFPGLEEKMGEQKVVVLQKDMQKGWFDKIKESYQNLFKPEEEDQEFTLTQKDV